MTTQAKHAPPLFFGAHDKHGIYRVHEQGVGPVAIDDLAKTCNSHDTLLAQRNALEKAVDMAAQRLEAIGISLSSYPRMSGDLNGRTLLACQEIAKESSRQARAALALVRGEKP